MKILFGISRNSTCYVDISTFFRVSSNLIHFHCSQRALRARKLARIDYLNGLAFILPFTFHLTVGNPEGEGGKCNRRTLIKKEEKQEHSKRQCWKSTVIRVHERCCSLG